MWWVQESLLRGKSGEVLRFERSGDPAARAERVPTGPKHAGIVPANYRLKPTVGGLGGARRTLWAFAHRSLARRYAGT